MAFKVENGSGVVKANAYGTVQGFRDYHVDRGVDVSGLSDSHIQSLLVKATDYIDTRWGASFKGEREYNGLLSRSVLTLTGQPADDETVMVGAVTYTFKTTASQVDDTEVEIGSSLIKSLTALSSALGASDNENFVNTFFADLDIASMTIFVDEDGVGTTETLTNGSFDQPVSYGSSFRLQPLEFPREKLYDSEGYQVLGIPDKLLYATYEYALRANTSSLAPDPTTTDSGGQVTKSREKIGPIETEVQYSSSIGVKITKPYPAADRLLSEYINRNHQVIRN